jgi:hypothetical protein
VEQRAVEELSGMAREGRHEGMIQHGTQQCAINQYV